jgi:hypothetical protein
MLKFKITLNPRKTKIFTDIIWIKTKLNQEKGNFKCKKKFLLKYKANYSEAQAISRHRKNNQEIEPSDRKIKNK